MAEAAPLALPQFGISSFHRIEAITSTASRKLCGKPRALQRNQYSSFTRQDDVLLLATNLLEALVSRQEKNLSQQRLSP